MLNAHFTHLPVKPKGYALYSPRLLWKAFIHAESKTARYTRPSRFTVVSVTPIPSPSLERQLKKKSPCKAIDQYLKDGHTDLNDVKTLDSECLLIPLTCEKAIHQCDACGVQFTKTEL